MGLEFSFDAKKYRKNLAENLNEKRAENPAEAKELLQKEQETLRYKVSEDIKKVLVKIEAKKQGRPEVAVEKPESKELSVETIKIEGSDGIEHELELHTLDISSQIPDEYKLLYDINRLMTLKHELPHLGISADTNQSSLEQTESARSALERTDSRNILKKYLEERFSEEKDSVLSEFDYGELEKIFQKEENLILELGFHEAKSFKFIRSVVQKMEKNIYDKVTGGMFSDKQSFNHIVSPFGRAQGYDYRPNTEEHVDLIGRYPHEHPEDIVNENVVDVREGKSNLLWMNAGGSTATLGGDTFTKMVIVCDSQEERFQNEVKDIRNTDFIARLHQQNIEPEVATIKEKIDFALEGGNAQIEFKKDEPWILLADWIIDPYHGRAYKIQELKNKGE